MTVSNRPINSCSSVQGCNRVSLSAGWPRTTVYPMTPSPLANIVRGIATLTPSASAAVSLGTYRNTKQLKADSCSTSNRGFSSASAKSRVRSTIQSIMSAKPARTQHPQRKPELQCVKPSRRQHRVRDEVQNCLVVVPLWIGQGWADLSALLAMVGDDASEWSDHGMFSN